MVTKHEIEAIRARALEEFRQELKWAPWSIGNLAIVEMAYDILTAKPPDQRYDEFLNRTPPEW